MRLFILLCAAALALDAADVTGRWTGKAEYPGRDGQARTLTLVMTLKQTGDAVTGSVGPSAADTAEIRNGKMIANKLTFEVVTDEGKAVVELAADGAALKGEAKQQRDSGVLAIKVAFTKQ